MALCVRKIIICIIHGNITTWIWLLFHNREVAWTVCFFECYTDKQSCCQTLIESWNSYSCKTLLRSSTSSHHAMSVKPHAYVADQSCLLSARKVRILISTSLICQSSQLFFRFFFTNLCDLMFMDDLKTFLCNTGKSER